MSGRDTTGRRPGAGKDAAGRALRQRLARSAAAFALALASAAAGASAHDAEASGGSGPDFPSGTSSSVRAAAADAPTRAPGPGALLTSAAERLRAAQRGIASWYGHRFHGRRTASGERFDMNALTAAHRTLPLDSEVSVRNPANGRTVRVRINDRGPFHPGRLIDLSRAAALALGVLDRPALVEVSRVVAPDAPAGEVPAPPEEETQARTAAAADEPRDGAAPAPAAGRPTAAAPWQPAAASSAEATD